MVDINPKIKKAEVLPSVCEVTIPYTVKLEFSSPMENGNLPLPHLLLIQTSHKRRFHLATVL
jgi:hypothetical protein